MIEYIVYLYKSRVNHQVHGQDLRNPMSIFGCPRVSYYSSVLWRVKLTLLPMSSKLLKHYKMKNIGIIPDLETRERF